MTEQFRNDGARRMTESKLPIRQIARELGVAASTVSRWASGDRQPEPGHAAKLEKLHGVPASSWGRQPRVPAATTAVEADVPAGSPLSAALGSLEDVPRVASRGELLALLRAELKALAADLGDDPAARALAKVVATLPDDTDGPPPSWDAVVLAGAVALVAPGSAAGVARALLSVEGGAS